MDGQAMKDQHVACIHVATYPTVSRDRIDWNLRDMQMFALMALNSKTMGAFQNSQRAYIDRAVV